MGCNSSTATSVVDPKQSIRKGKNRPPTPGPKSISFVVQLDENPKLTTNSALIQNKLPKRLQRLQENSAPLTADEIAQRQKLAELRRKSAIEERVLKSKQFLAKVQAVNRSGNSSLKSDSGRGSRISTATVKIDEKSENSKSN